MIKWNEVTWYSRIAAIIVFVGILPVINFVVGVQYEETQSALTQAQIAQDPLPVSIVHKPRVSESTTTPSEIPATQE